MCACFMVVVLSLSLFARYTVETGDQIKRTVTLNILGNMQNKGRVVFKHFHADYICVSIRTLTLKQMSEMISYEKGTHGRRSQKPSDKAVQSQNSI